MNKTTNGSSVVLVLIVMSGLIMLCMALFKSTEFLKRLSIHRVQVQENNQLNLGLLEYGIKIVQTNFEKMAYKDFSYQIEVALNQSKGTINLEGQEELVEITAWVERAQKIDSRMKCEVVRGPDKKLHVQSFQNDQFPL